MEFLRSFAFILLGFSSVALGNAKVIGNGGTGVACYTKNNAIKSVEIFDLWEAKILEGLSPIPTTKDPFVLASEKVAELDRVSMSGGDFFSPIMQTMIIHIKSNMQMLPKGARLALTGDVNTVLSPGSGCEFVQLLNFSDNGRVYVVTDLWDKLDNVNKAALLTHEAVYWYLRDSAFKGTETTSVRARRIVSLTFAGKQLEEKKSPIGSDLFQCREDIPKAKNKFYIYKDENGDLRIEFSNILGRISFDRISMLLKSQIESQVKSFSDLAKLDKYFISGNLNSQIDRDYIFSFYKDPTGYSLYIANVNTNENVTVKMSCHFE